MGKSKDLTPRKASAVKTMLEETNLSQRVIALKCGISAASVNRVRRKLDMGKDYCEDRAVNRRSSGVKPKFSTRNRRTLIRLCKQNRRATSVDLARQISRYGEQVSSRTVRRELCKAGFAARRPVKKAKLTPAMTKKRYLWALRHKDWTENDWSRVCFSDESKICILHESSLFVRRRCDEALLPECVSATVKYPTSVMIWGAISVYGPGRLYIVDGIMRHEQYIKLLETRLIPQMSQWFPQGDGIYIQDGAPCHTAKRVLNFLTQHNIRLLDWPGNSPDLNPIENFWRILKRRVSTRKPTTKRALIESILQVWHGITMTRFANCVQD